MVNYEANLPLTAVWYDICRCGKERFTSYLTNDSFLATMQIIFILIIYYFILIYFETCINVSDFKGFSTCKYVFSKKMSYFQISDCKNH